MVSGMSIGPIQSVRQHKSFGIVKIRIGTSNDLSFLSRMLFEAFFWNPGYARPSFEKFLQDPRFQLLQNWGRPGDNSVIADDEGKPIGAAWCRLWTDEEHSYGYVDAETPEIGMGVERDYRSKGIGRALLRSLIQEVRNQGIRKLSLSVDPANFARQLYESEGFVRAGQSGTSWTYVKNLAG